MRTAENKTGGQMAARFVCTPKKSDLRMRSLFSAKEFVERI
jgi:hypothetical protein